MVTFKSVGTVANGARRRMPWKLMAAAAFVACAFGGVALGIARATAPQGFTSTPLVGPVVLDEIHTVHQTPDYGVMIKSRGLSDVYVTHIRIAPGGDGGWHSHPGPSIITVKSGTATFYDECNDFVPEEYPTGTGFVEDAGCVHLLANEGNVDLEVVVVQIVPRGAPRRIDEPAPF
jgi:quercetin dioxygenase-like cupin family protein